MLNSIFLASLKQPFRKALRELGDVGDRSITWEYRHGNDTYDRPGNHLPPAGGGRRKVPIGRSKKPEKQPDLRESAQELEDRVNGHQLPRIAVVPATDDAPTLYETWVGMGGEGVVLKDPASFLSCGVMPGKSEPVLRNS